MSISRRTGTIRRGSNPPGPPPTPPNEAETAANAIIAAVPSLTSPQQTALRTFVTKMVNAGFWAKRPVMYLAKCGLVNIKSPGTYDLTPVGTPVYDEGCLSGDGLWHGDSGFVPGVALNQFAADSHNVKLYCRTSLPDAASGFEFGNTNTEIALGIAGGAIRTRSNQTTSTDTVTHLSASGMFEIDRSSHTQYELRWDDQVLDTITKTSGTLSATESFLVLKNLKVANKSKKILAFVGWGSSFSLAETAAENAVIEEYLAAVGCIGLAESQLQDAMIVWTGINGNRFKVSRPTGTGNDGPYSASHIQSLGRNGFIFSVENGDRADSTTRERSELIADERFQWGEDAWFRCRRTILHYALNVHDDISIQWHDYPSAGNHPMCTITTGGNASLRGEKAGFNYKNQSDPDIISPPGYPVTYADPFRTVEVEFIMHLKLGLSSRGETGIVQVWSRAAGEANFTQHIDYSGDVGHIADDGTLLKPYVIVGIYSQGTNGAPSTPDGNDSLRSTKFREFEYGSTPYPVI